MSDVLAQTLALPCGAVIPNRLAKAAMTEGLATQQGVATPELERLYGVWSDGGAGMLLQVAASSGRGTTGAYQPGRSKKVRLGPVSTR